MIQGATIDLKTTTTTSTDVVAGEKPTATTTVTTGLLGKRKETPVSPPTFALNESARNPLVDAAFKRLFGYSWGTTFNLSNGNSKVARSSAIENQMVQIFGPTRTARIMNLPWEVVAPLSCDPTNLMGDSYNPAMVLTTKIGGVAPSSVSMPLSSGGAEAASSASHIHSARKATKKRRLEETDYKNIALPAHMVSSSSVSNAPATEGAQALANIPANPKTTTTKTHASNLDNVLSQIAGKKELNTVEKSSNDWEGFKETDKTLQDELERQAQGKNAYLVKQDFLNRVDQRTFELEKEERDRERSRRAAESK